MFLRFEHCTRLNLTCYPGLRSHARRWMCNRDLGRRQRRAGRWVSSLLLSVLLAGAGARAASPINSEASLSYSRPSQEDKGIRLLEPGKKIERQLSGGKGHVYQISLAAGQYLQVIVDQRGIDVVVTLLGPDGKKMAEVDSPNGSQGPEPVSVIAEAPGNYRLEVRSLENTAPAGRYEVKILELRIASPQDISRIAAAKAYAEGWRHQEQKTAASLQQAIERFKEALPLWRAAGDRVQEADTLSNIGEAYQDLSERQKALDYYSQALAVRRVLGNERGVAEALNNIASVYHSMGENPKALDYYAQALELWRAAGDRTGEASTLSNMGATYTSLGQPQKALEYFGLALPIRRAVADRAGEAATLNNMGNVHVSLGEPQKALDYFNQAIPAVRAAGDQRGAAYTTVNIGLVNDSLGEKQTALDHYAQAFAILQRIGDRYGMAALLNNMALLYYSLGENQKALDYYGQALKLVQTLGDRYGQASVLNGIGKVYDSSGDREKALEHFNQALPLRRAVNDRAGEANTLFNLGGVYENLGEKQKAFDYYNQALVLWQTVGDRRGEAQALTSIGTVHKDLGEPDKALDLYNRALPIHRTVGNRSGEAGTLYEMARFERGRGNLITARSQIETALKLIESLRTKIGSQQLRATYFASVQKYYELYIDVLMRLYRLRPGGGFDAEAVQASESARARILLEMLGEAQADIRQGADPALLERERSLQHLLTAKTERLMRLMGRKGTEASAASAAQEIQTLTEQFEEVEAQIRATSPRYAALTQPQPLTVKEIQERVLDSETLLLEYALGEERSYLWLISTTSLSSYELPKRADIEAAARQFYQLLTEPAEQYKRENRNRGLRVAKADAQNEKLAEAAARLSRMLLWPVASRLGTKRLLIVSEGALQYVPFAALPIPEATPRAAPLITRHEIVSAPSASALAALRRETSGRRPAAKALAVLADPVFDISDDRARSLESQEKPVDQPRIPVEQRGLTIVAKAATESGAVEAGMELPRLPGTRQEADRILALVGPGARKRAVDFEASRTTATSEELSNYRIIHFATHGFLNSVHPQLSGIVLSMVDAKGAPQQGFLLAHEVYNLKLPAELVVLSACQTGLGKEIRGEGLVGLTRGLMYAGAARVVVSLWSVDDEATANLMVALYTDVLKNGRRPAAALRAAQVKMWKQKKWRAPYYWAAFVLQGEWR